MTVSHHSHSGEFCCHAKGTLSEVVDEAIRQGFSTFCLSEHVPRYQESHMYPEESHLSPADLAATFDAYLVEAHRLKKLHASRLSILVGLETEFIDAAGLDELEALIERKGDAIEYLVGSVHHCDELPIDFDKERFDHCVALQPGSDEGDRLGRLFATYFDCQLELLRRLEPEVVGHFDLCRLYYPGVDFRAFPDVWAKIERNIEYATSYGALFEVNASAFRKGWSTAYPGTEVFDLILAKGGRFTLSDDSHGPQAVGLHYDSAYAYLRDRNVQELWRLIPASRTDPGVKRGVRAEKIEGRPWLDAWPQLLETTKREA
ncbi:polymerase/histidinol phosphatase-like protein [Rhodotorula diobovata]|uniref:Histidinol-phosphatase n=1 Tax=Rhodotorula diobovata TaxID=5288 RepID=A0A5C5G114_9BASI|nr:polymerase/histidinol phosphatase-like protein [Rhodotorula diobovata]